MVMERKYVPVTDKNFKEKSYFSPYDEKHTNFLNEFIEIEVANAPEPSVATVLNGVEDRFLNEHIVLGQAARLTVFDNTYDYLRANGLWADLFVIPDIPEPEVTELAAEDIAEYVDAPNTEPPELINA